MKSIRVPSLIFIVLSVLCGTAGLFLLQSYTGDNAPKQEIPATLPWSERMARTILLQHPEAWMTDFRQAPKWGYTNGLVLQSIYLVGEAQGNQRYTQYAQSYADTMINARGEIRDYKIEDFNLDNINPGKLVFQLYKKTGDPRYLTVIQTLRRQLKWQPRTTDGGFWHKLIYPWQMWLDGLYMAAPFYAEYAATFNEPQAFDDVIKQIILMEKHARDSTSGLLYHGWDESTTQRWANPQTGQSPSFWGRAIGWYAMSIVDVLDFLPKEHPQRATLLRILQRTVDGIIAYQDESTGLWYQVVDQAGRPGNYLEATVSSMMIYTLAKAVNKGYLPPHYTRHAKKAFDGIIHHLMEVQPSGALQINQCCAVSGLGGKPYRDGSYEYYVHEQVRTNDPKATGPFILACLELEKMDTTARK